MNPQLERFDTKWQKEYDEAFGDFTTSALWYKPVRQFICDTLARQREVIRKIAEKEKMKKDRSTKFKDFAYNASLSWIQDQLTE